MGESRDRHETSAEFQGKPYGRLPAVARGASFACLGAGIATWACIIAQPGTLGLMEWVPKYALYFALIPVISALPTFLLTVASTFARRPDGAGRTTRFIAARISYLLSVVTGGFLTLSIAALLAWFLAGIGTVGAYERPILLPEGESPVPLTRLAFSSDPHFGATTNDLEATKAIISSVARGPYDAFFVLGDLSETGFPGRGLEDAATALAEGLGTKPLATLEGNHDYLVGGSRRYARIFSRPPYWKIDSGNVHVIALDLPWGTERFGANQKAWLEDALAAIPSDDFTVVLSHCYFWASGYSDPETGKPWYDQKDMIAEVAPILERGGVDLVVSGHNHYMEYLENGGVSWAVIGAMGGIPDPEPTWHSPASRWFSQGTFGFLDLDLTVSPPILAFRDVDGYELYHVSLGAAR